MSHPRYKLTHQDLAHLLVHHYDLLAVLALFKRHLDNAADPAPTAPAPAPAAPAPADPAPAPARRVRILTSMIVPGTVDRTQSAAVRMLCRDLITALEINDRARNAAAPAAPAPAAPAPAAPAPAAPAPAQIDTIGDKR